MIVLSDVRRIRVIQLWRIAQLDWNPWHNPFAYLMMVHLPPITPFPKMPVLENFDAIKYWAGGNSSSLQVSGQHQVIMIARPLAQMLVDFIAITPARELVGKFCLMHPDWMVHYIA